MPAGRLDPREELVVLHDGTGQPAILLRGEPGEADTANQHLAACGRQQGRLFDPRTADKPPVAERLLAALKGGRTAANHPSPARDDTLTQVCEIVESEAVDVIGPIAGVLCAEHCAEVRDLHSLNKALERIAVQIHDPDRAEELQRRVMERLSKSLPAFV